VRQIHEEETTRGVPERGANEKTLLSLWIIWAAMAGSLLVYVFICYQFGEEIRRNMGHHFPVPLLRNTFYVITIITLFFTHFLKRRMLSGTSRASSSNALQPGPHSNQAPFLAKYTTALVVSLALSESIGIYGLVLFLLGDGFKTLYTFIGISALAIYFHRPKKEELDALVIAMQTDETPSPQP
jgi:hypothetical protein